MSKVNNLVLVVLLIGVIFWSRATVYGFDADKDLTNFIEEYTSTKEKTWQVLEEADLGFENTMILNTARSVDISLIELQYYDMLGAFSVDTGNRIEGKLFFSGFSAFKELKDDRIIAGYDHVYQESKMYMYEEGDKDSERVTLNLINKELEYYSVRERNGAIIQKSVTELVQQQDGDYLLQYFFWKEGKETNCVFMTFNDTAMDFIIASDKVSEQLEYRSILKSNLSPEEMADGYAKLLAVQVSDNQLEYQNEF